MEKKKEELSIQGPVGRQSELHKEGPDRASTSPANNSEEGAISRNYARWSDHAAAKISSFLKDKYNLAFLVVLFLAFLIRLKYIGQESIWNDAAVHLWYAIKVTHQPLFIFTQEYLLGDYATVQTLTAFLYLFTKNVLLAGQIVAMFYAIIGIIFMYLLGTEIRSRFTGLMAATLLAFNHLFWFYSARPLGDSPLLVTTIVLLYCMVRLEKEKTLRWGILSGVMFLAAMFTKQQSVLYIFALVIYVLLFRRKEMFKNKALLASWLIPVVSILIAHVVGKIFFHAKVLDRIFKLFFDLRGLPFGFEAAGMLQWIFSWYLIPFVIIGALLVIFYREKKYYFGLTLFAFYYLFFEVNVDNTQDRYVLPLFSIAILLAVFALEEISTYISMFIHKFAKPIIVIVVVIFISWNYYQVGDALNYNKSFSYLGYQEAGQWMKENVPAKDPIFVGEYRSIRAFSEREFGGPMLEDYGGNIINLRSPYRYSTEGVKPKEEEQRNFEEDILVLSQSRDIYLEIDIWEYAQPTWYWPLSQASLDYFVSLGFYPVKIIERPVLTKDGPKTIPVIFILKKDRTGTTANGSLLQTAVNDETQWRQKFLN
ncbi:glycosyltransferase family 39 protein [Candidatus Woesearchaeota archaeon]|nr:glycosyltransferase family 39 protein [Candidatus Woesearchaeota archaeon]